MTPAYRYGLDMAWDYGAAPYDRNACPWPVGSDEAKACYLGYREGCAQVAEHREDLPEVGRELKK